MLDGVRNLLYRRPDLYEIVYPEPNDETPQMCRRMLRRFLDQPPKSILDVGCGTGRDIFSLSRNCPECVGVDCLSAMVEYARSRYPMVTFEVGDMRKFRTNRTFDLITCMGSAFMYAVDDADVDATMDTFVAHAHENTLLILDINNAASYLPGGTFEEKTEREIRFLEGTATVTCVYTFDRRRQRLIRSRTWSFPKQPAIDDYCEYRLFFPVELERLLHEKGFEVAGMYDNMELTESDLAGSRLYVASQFR